MFIDDNGATGVVKEGCPAEAAPKLHRLEADTVNAAGAGSVETQPDMGPKVRLVYHALTVIVLLSSGLFAIYWLSLPQWHTHFFLSAAFSLLIALAIASFLQSWFGLRHMRRPCPMPAPAGMRVAMITTFVPGAEPLDMLEATLLHMRAVRYPHDIWVLDEGDDPEVGRLCAALRVNHFSRKSRADLNADDGPMKSKTKYGNVNAWLREIGYDRYDIVSAFDPDHAPLPHFLESVLGYFRDPSVGFVQAPQVYYNQESNFIARGAAEETYGYYSSTLMSGFGVDYVVTVGCHNTHRVTALKQIGGFAPHDADDLLIALNYRAASWHGVYVPDVLAVGLTPVDWPAYLRQQRRWCRSVFDIKLRRLPGLWAKLPPAVRTLAVNQGLSYIPDTLLPTGGVFVLCWFLITGDASLLSNLIGHQFLLLMLSLAAVDLFRQYFYLDGRTERGLHFRAGLLKAAKWPFLLLGMADALFARKPAYEITSKVKTKSAAHAYLWPHLLIALTVAGCWLYAMSAGTVTHWALHFWSFLLFTVSLAIYVSGFLPVPSAFDRPLLEKAMRRLMLKTVRPGTAGQAPTPSRQEAA